MAALDQDIDSLPPLTRAILDCWPQQTSPYSNIDHDGNRVPIAPPRRTPVANAAALAAILDAVQELERRVAALED